MENENNPIEGTATLTSSLGGWMAHPFTTAMSVKGWALFVGLIVVLTILWVMVLKDLRGEV